MYSLFTFHLSLIKGRLFFFFLELAISREVEGKERKEVTVSDIRESRRKHFKTL